MYKQNRVAGLVTTNVTGWFTKQIFQQEKYMWVD